MLGETSFGRYDVVVVGAGIMGSCSAYHLAKQGLSVLLLEQFDFLHHRGSSHGESRIIRPTYPEDYYTEMMIRAYQLWAEAESEAGYSVLTKTGGLDFGSLPKLQSILAACRKHGIPHEVLDSLEIRRRFGIHSEETDVGVYNSEAGILNATKACAMFQQLARQNGAVLKDRTKVLEIRPSHHPKFKIGLKTSGGSVEASHCVVAAGAWASKLVEHISGKAVLPIQPLHLTVSYWRVLDGKFSAEDGFPVFINYDDPYVYGLPVNEYPGLLKVCLHTGPPCDPDDRELLPDLGLIRSQLSPWMSRRFGEQVVSGAPVMTQACMYSMTPDQDFVLDFVNLPCDDDKVEQVLRPVVVLAGFSGHGFKLAPLIGKIASDMVVQGSSSEADMHLFRLDRFVASEDGNKGKPVNEQGPHHSDAAKLE